MVSQKLNRNTLTLFILIHVLKLPQFTLLKLENLKTQFFTTLSVTTKQLIFLWRNTTLFAVCLQSFKTFKIIFWVFPTLKTHQTFFCSSLIPHVAYQSQHQQLFEVGKVLSSMHAQSWKRTLGYQGEFNSDGSLHPLSSNSLFTGYIVHTVSKLTGLFFSKNLARGLSHSPSLKHISLDWIHSSLHMITCVKIICDIKLTRTVYRKYHLTNNQQVVNCDNRRIEMQQWHFESS